ncbi:MAG: tRNA (adenosine(37)-N6)-threonylcarbamoyltransferase complex ATPase subunit type 1 TsaE [Candidatus Omnitrophica bacterium]|nr:tRNA (adenosine(37)-N6)-threonylcarbamoyltransferase complex ATPase subunit type 1 TsaE [Candidatus Omnitrophota bacterium]MCM8788312.1 tRNA (adenosine(37)-N6)-threonylcarbamoyltransferase complex ATPase subunit type 1 TsaE [Candidatus Omnitrophota bacterium]
MAKKPEYVEKSSDTFLEKKIFHFETNSSKSTEMLGRKLAKWIKKYKVRCVIFLGPFGSGKTTMIRGVIKSLTGITNIPSPSFSIVNQYSKGKMIVYHFDFYRIKNAVELESFGFSEYIDNGLLLIEWPEVAMEKIPAKALKVTMNFLGLKRRKITIAFI